MKRSQGSSLGYYTICIATLFLAGFLLLVVFGAQSYRNTVAEQNRNMQSRALLSYLATCVRANDSADAVSVVAGTDGPILVIADGDSGYALRIYRQEGCLWEEYAALDAPIDSGEAQLIGETERFEIEEHADGLLAVYTDAGRVLLGLRSEGGASG